MRHDKGPGLLMPVRPVDDDNGMSMGWNSRGDFGQMQVHGVKVDFRQNQSDTLIARRTNRAEDIGIVVTLVAFQARARAAFGPDARQPAFLPDPGFVLEPELEAFAAGVCGEDFRHVSREVFLKAAWAAGSLSG